MNSHCVQNGNIASRYEEFSNKRITLADEIEQPELMNERKLDADNMRNDLNCGGLHKFVLPHDLIDEPDNVQRRSSRAQESHNLDSKQSIDCFVRGESEIDSTLTTPSQSTMSSPLSSPTRYIAHLQSNHKHCCQHKSISNVGCTINASFAHNHIEGSKNWKSMNVNGCKPILKYESRLGPSPYRQLLPIALCILSFAAVFSILVIYMDTTEIRHQQFRLNMSRDDELYGIAQDDPTLVAFLREIHMRKYPMHFSKEKNAYNVGQKQNVSGYNDGLALRMGHYVVELLGGKMDGAAIQSLTGNLGHLIIAPWLSETLHWDGVIIEPEPQRYFSLRKQNAFRPRMQVVHACVSNNANPKEITIHNGESDVQINSILDEDTSWFNSRVKCFPLYTIMLACERVEFDLLSLGVHGYELEILQTLPFDRIKIEVISIHLTDDHHNKQDYIESITKFLEGKYYKLQNFFGANYFYQRINSTTRIHKKDTHLLKTP